MSAKVILIISMRSYGGAEKQAHLLYTKLGFDKIICLESGNGYNVPQEKIVHLTQQKPATPVFIKYLSIPLYVIKIAALLKKYKGEVQVVSFMERANYCNILLKILLKHKAVVSVRVHPAYFTGINKLSRAIMLLLYKFADCITSNSAESLLYFQKKGFNKNKLKTVHNGYDISHIHQLAKEALPGPINDLFKYPVISNMGRMHEQKGQIFLLHIFSAIKKSIPDAKLLFIGSGAKENDILKEAALLGLKVCKVNKEAGVLEVTADVFLFGVLANPFNILSKTAVFAFPSLYEGLPNALIESIACNIPCVAAACPSGPREIITPDLDLETPVTSPIFTTQGVLMPPFSVSDYTNIVGAQKKILLWAGVITKLLTDGVLHENTKKSNQVTAKNYSEENIVWEWGKTLQNIPC